MAVFTSSKTQYQFYLKLTMEETAAGAYNSQPQVSYNLQLYSGGWNFNLLRINAYVKLGDTVIAQLNAADQQWTLGTKSNITLLSGTASVPYDGSGSLPVEYAIDMDESYWQYAPDITATGTMPLTPYAQPASEPSLSASSVEMGKAVTINTNRKDAYTHIISYKFGGVSGTIANNVGDSVSWTPPISLASQIPNDTIGICVITCETFSNGDSVGTKSVNLELTVPASVVPTISAFTATRVDNGVPSAWGIYVKGYSKARLQTTAVGAYGSTIQSCAVFGELPGADVTTGVLNTAGEKQFSVTVKDSRGRSATASVTINVVDYSKPSISGANFARCDADGTDNDDGTSIKAYGVISIASCDGKNSYTAQVQYKLSTASNWTAAGAYSSGNTSVYAVGLTDATYDVRIAVTDGLNTVYAADKLDVGTVLAEYHRDTGVLEFPGPINFGKPDAVVSNLFEPPVNGYWKSAAIGISVWHYENASKTNHSVPHVHCEVLVVKRSRARGTAMAFGWVRGDYRIWRSVLHDDYQSNAWSEWVDATTAIGARPNTWLPSLDEIGAMAAGGYWLTANSASDLNNVKQNGVFRLSSALSINGISADMLICFEADAGNCYIQIAVGYNSHAQIRSYWYGTWYEWLVIV